MSISAKDIEMIWHPYTQMKNVDLPIVMVKGEGVWLVDENDNKYLDAISSWWVNSHGHAHPHIAKKVSEQVQTLEHVIFAGFTHPKAVELAERLLGVLPSNQSSVFYSDNGSTAVEVALKMAIQYWENKKKPKKGIVAFKDAYHGDTFGAMAVSGRGAFVKPFESMLFDVQFIDAPIPGKEKNSLAQLETILDNRNLNIGAFIYEPLIQGAAGMVMYQPDALDPLLELCRKNDVFCIADEVMTGFGRTGKFFASDHLTVKPDIVCMSKGLTGGTMALGATSCSKEIFSAFLSDDKQMTLFHGHSFTGNPVACAAACASLDLFDLEETWLNIERISSCHKKFAERLAKVKGVSNIRQTGTILAFELSSNEETSYFNPKRDSIYKFFIERKIILRPLGNVIYILPPYCITDDELNLAYTAITDLLESQAT